MDHLDRCIEESILLHFRKHNIHIGQDDISGIINRVKCGEYAFQVIYTEIVSYKGRTLYEFSLLKPLNDLLLSREGDHWNYKRDSNVTNSYSEIEILFFNRNEIRDIKLKFGLNI